MAEPADREILQAELHMEREPVDISNTCYEAVPGPARYFLHGEEITEAQFKAEVAKRHLDWPAGW